VMLGSASNGLPVSAALPATAPSLTNFLRSITVLLKCVLLGPF
jgi:hypothetical protein